MKNLLFTLNVLLAGTLLKAQPYRPLLLDSSYWRVNYNATQMNCSCSVYYLYKTNGDTLINGLTYKKIIRVGASGCSTCGPYSGAILGSLRQDSLARKVYIVQNGTSTEKILYDFTQQAGDTVKSTLAAVCSHVVSSVDSVQINSVYHRRINIQTDGCLVMPQSFIEGIGSTQGLLEPLIGFEYGGTLVCAGHKNQVIYPSNTSSCSTVVTGIDDMANEGEMAIVFPNPGTGTFYLRFNTNETYSIKVIDVLGNLIVSKENTNEKVLIMNDKPKGIYFLELSHKGLKEVKKIVVE